MCKSGLPEQERRNFRSDFERDPGRGRFHVRAGRNESHPAVGTVALMDWTRATVYVPGVREMMEDVVKEVLKRSRGQRKGRNFSEKNFLEGVSLEEASVSIG